jgi:POT family proton-dependent oligopeptide transporter
MSESVATSSQGEATIGGHPRGLVVLFGAEMWERFSFYGMRSLLVLYLVNYLHWQKPDANGLYGTYLGLVYLSGLLGGVLADRFLGQRKAILVGGIVIATGHFVLAFEPLLYLGLGLVVIGTGYLKPNISTIVGQLYPQGDSRRDAGYSIFYMGIQVGATFGPLICGYLAANENLGWHYGFAAAGLGMVFGLINFAMFQRWLGSGGHAPGRGDDPRIYASDWLQVVLLAAATCVLVYLGVAGISTVQSIAPKVGQLVVLCYWVVLSLGLIALAALSYRMFERRTALENAGLRPELRSNDLAGDSSVAASVDVAPPLLSARSLARVAVVAVVSIFSIVFWMGFEQAGSTLTLFADEKTDRVLFGHVIETAWFQSINPAFLLLLAPLFSVIWTMIDRTRFALNSAAKMGLGLVILGLAYYVMYRADNFAGTSGKVGPQWLVVVYLLNSIGELCLSPIGLSLVNKLAPRQITSLMMAFWFCCTAAGGYLAGHLESLITGRFNLWMFLVVSSAVPGLILLVLSPTLKKMSQGRL